MLNSHHRGAFFQPQVAGGELDSETLDVLELAEDLSGRVMSLGRATKMGMLVQGNESMKGFHDGSKEGDKEGFAIVVVGIGRRDGSINSEEERVSLRNQRIEPFGNGAADQGFDVGDFVEDMEDNRIGYGVELVGLIESISRVLHNKKKKKMHVELPKLTLSFVLEIVRINGSANLTTKSNRMAWNLNFIHFSDQNQTFNS